jgi:uncharacterized phage-like protein YoqJ
MLENFNQEYACCFTGHREIPEEVAESLTGRLTAQINDLYANGVKTFLVGGAVGFDTLAAQAVIQCREVHTDIRLILVIPCQDQASHWKPEDIAVYERIKAMADDAVCLAEHYYRGCMQRRNRYLVDHSGTCVCYLNRASGGTAYTVKYAKSKGKTIFNLAQSAQDKT